MERDYIKEKRGITFVEIVISLLLLSIATVAVVGAFVIGKTSAVRAKHRVSAINLARQKIETVKGLQYSQIPSQASTEPVIIDQGSPATGDELTGQRTTVVFDIYANSKIYKITTTVTWTELSQIVEERITTLISRH